ncbi:MAG: 2-C-methyl-D-erythritol 2,4-cyclodiphosphate synthase [Bdellovibrionales bacterium]|nr:2-C-methyl-D-erythritol 2,4-cyclodiphosphate synthase [Bdellovibrionales bacterium]
MKSIRVGQGLDIHPFDASKKCVLGGVTIPGNPGLKGHSDADALTHAICDALLGAMCEGDLGQHFADTDPAHKNQSSLYFLKQVMQLVQDQNWTISNIDSTVLTEAPMLKTHIPEMKKVLCPLLEISESQFSIKATRPEKLGALGRKEGLMALATVLIFQP